MGVWVLGSGAEIEPVVGGGAYGDGNNGDNNNTWVWVCECASVYGNNVGVGCVIVVSVGF